MSRRLTPAEREWYGNEGVAHGIYSRHAAAMERGGTHVPKWEWLTEGEREKWRLLARERVAEGMNSEDGFTQESER